MLLSHTIYWLPSKGHIIKSSTVEQIWIREHWKSMLGMDARDDSRDQ